MRAAVGTLRRMRTASAARAAACSMAPGHGAQYHPPAAPRRRRLRAVSESAEGRTAAEVHRHDPHVHDSRPRHSAPRVEDLAPSHVSTAEEADYMLLALGDAQAEFLGRSQADVDRITFAVARAADLARVTYARLAVEETGMGLLEDKVVKNHFAAEYVWSRHANMKTVGIIDEDPSRGLTTIARPVGPIASLVPCTNPTSTIVFQIINAMKTRNAIVFLPHPRARKVSEYVVRHLLDVAVAAGAPAKCIACIDPSVELSNFCMSHEAVRFVLATGGGKMVRAAYKSGKPTIAVGAGNCAAIVDETANLDDAVGLIVTGKTFDHGVVCATEQATVVVDDVYESFCQKLEERGVHFVRDPVSRARLAETFYPEGKLNTDVVGQSAQRIATLAGLDGVPSDALVLAVEAVDVGPEEPFSYEKLCPILAVYRAVDFDDALRLCADLARNHGEGHTSSLHTNVEMHRDRIRRFELEMPTCHNLVNVPSSLGAIGGPYNMHLEPSLTLGVGTGGGSSQAKNVGPHELLNLSTTAERTEHIEWFKVPHSVYFNKHCIRDALHDLVCDDPRDSDLNESCSSPPCSSIDQKSRTRVLVVTDSVMVRLGMLRTTLETLDSMCMTTSVFDGILPDPTMAVIRDGIEEMERFQPDVVIAVGGGSAIDAAKVMRLMYEHPEFSLEDMALRFIEIRRRIIKFPMLGTRVKKLVCIPTTSGTGAEVTPFAVITSDEGQKYPLTSYALVPDIAIIDPSLAMSQPKMLSAYCGLDALTHALESLVSTYASDYTIPLSVQATRLLLKHLEPSVRVGLEVDRAKVHHAATIAGLAFGNAFLGIAHSCAHQLGSAFHVPHGLACALCIPHVMRFNAVPNPTRMGLFSQYTHPVSTERYAMVARQAGLKGDDDIALLEALIDGIEELKATLGVPATLMEWPGLQASREEVEAQLEDLAVAAFDDQCTGTNPRYPLIAELRDEILRKACFGEE